MQPRASRTARSASVLPVDFSGAEPAVIPPGGAVSLPPVNTGGAYAAKLSQDGVHVGFSDIRTDSVEMMVVGSLQRSGGNYDGQRSAGDQPARRRPRRLTRARSLV